MTKWQPSGNKILVLMDKVDKYSAGGIALPEVTTERGEMAQMEGTVVAMGPQAYNDQQTQWVAVGDRVKITKFGGWLHSEGGDKYRVIQDLDVIMVLKAEQGDSNE